MRVLVTGASGFSGRHMIRHLSSLPGKRPEVFGVFRSSPLRLETGVTPVRADLVDREQAARLVRKVAPDCVVHLAGMNRGSLKELLEVNVVGTEHLLDAVRDEAPCARTLVIGSSAEYGYAGEGPVPETAPFRPVSPYGISKAAEDLLAHRYHAVHDLPVAVAVPFNLIGPGLPESFVGGRIVKQALEVAGGKRTALELAGLDSRRDFVDVRDAVAAYWQLLTADGFEKRIAGKRFNIGSGVDCSIGGVLDLVQRLVGARLEVRLPEKAFPELVPTQTADIRRIRASVDWEPRRTLDVSIGDMLASAGSG